MSKVTVKPIEKPRWHGYKGLQSLKRAKTIRALVDVNTMTYQTGLTDKEREELGQTLKIDLSNNFVVDTPHPVWDSKIGQVKLENRTNTFDTEIPNEYLKLKILRASSLVAPSLSDFNEGKYPEAEYYISDEEEEYQTKATKVELRNKLILETAKLSKARKISLILALTGSVGDYHAAKNLKGKSDNLVNVELDMLIEKRPKEVLARLSMSAQDIEMEALVLEALQKSVLLKAGHRIMYHDSEIGESIPDVVQYLNKPENQEFKLRLISQVN